MQNSHESEYWFAWNTNSFHDIRNYLFSHHLLLNDDTTCKQNYNIIKHNIWTITHLPIWTTKKNHFTFNLTESRASFPYPSGRPTVPVTVADVHKTQPLIRMSICVYCSSCLHSRTDPDIDEQSQQL